MSEAFAVQMRFGIPVVLVDVALDRVGQLGSIAKTPRRRRFCVRSRKKRSTMLVHDVLVGVK
jgi:hypothetical protein